LLKRAGNFLTKAFVKSRKSFDLAYRFVRANKAGKILLPFKKKKQPEIIKYYDRDWFDHRELTEPNKPKLDTVTKKKHYLRLDVLKNPKVKKTITFGSVAAAAIVVAIFILPLFFVTKPTLSAKAPNGQFTAKEEPAFSLSSDGIVKTRGLKTGLGKVVTEDGTISASVKRGNQITGLRAEISSAAISGDDFNVRIQKPSKFKPGLYTLEVSLQSGKIEQTLSQDFFWGVLALNPDKAVYKSGEDAFISLAVLDNKGYMNCDAKLYLIVTDPTGNTKTLSTDDGTIKVSENCHVYDNENPTPDYFTSYKTGTSGTYKLTLNADTTEGFRTIQDGFLVNDQTPFYINRDEPTRIYPAKTVKTNINITAQTSFNGSIEETVPASFIVTPGDFVIEERGDQKVIVWNKNFQQGETQTLEYRYKAPDVSPEFYLSGPLKFISNSNALEPRVIYEEPRQWMIASDATVTFSTAGSGNWSAPYTGNIQIECWGAGGAGGGNNTTADGGGGGGGGGYSIETSYAVTKNSSYPYVVGNGGDGVASSAGTAGTASTFNTNICVANGGNPGQPPVSGAGGVRGTGGAVGTGDTRYAGGAGETGRNSNTGNGGYGGSSAGTAANGYSGPTTWATITYPTGSTPAGGGHGGNGGAANAHGSAPASGSGGGGGGSGDGTARIGGAGADGKIVITLTDNTPPTVALNTGDGSAFTTGTPALQFTGTDSLYADDIRYNIQIDTSSSFDSQGGNPLLSKVSGTDAGFSGSPDNTDPFASGQQVTFTVQGGDSLFPGTYYWRVSGSDPGGTNTYGAWSSPTRTFTVIGITVGATGTQDATLEKPSTGQYVGGAFTMVRNSGTANVASIIVSDTGTVNANSNLSNLTIKYETAATCTYDGTESTFGTAATFNGSEKATVTNAGLSVGTSQVCFYPIVDVGSGASLGDTIELQITNPSTEVTASAGLVGPTTAVAISGSTTLGSPFNISGQIHTSVTSGTVRVAYGNTLQGQSSSITIGSPNTFNITGLTTPGTGQVVTIWIDGPTSSADIRTVAFKYSGSGSVTDINMNTSTPYLKIGTASQVSSMTLTELGQYDRTVTGDADIIHSSDSGTLNTNHGGDITNSRLYIEGNSTLNIGTTETVSTYTYLNNPNSTTTCTGNATINVSGTFYNYGTFNIGTSTVYMNGTEAQLVQMSYVGGGTNALRNLVVANTTNPVTLNTVADGTVDVSGTLTVNSGGVLRMGDPTYTLEGTGTLTGSGTVQVTRSSGDDFASQYTITNKTLTNLTIDYAGTAGQQISSVTSRGITISGTINTSANFATVGGGEFNVTATGNFSPTTGTITFNNGSSITNSGTLNFWNVTLASSAAVTTSASFSIAYTYLANTGAGLTASTGTITFSATTSVNLTAASSQFNDVVFSGTGGQWTLQTNIDVNGNISLSLGTLIANGKTINVGGDWTRTSGGFTAGTGEVIFDAGSAGKTITSGNVPFNKLTFNNSNGGWTLSGATTVNSDLTAIAGTVGGSSDVTVSGNVTGAGTLNFTGGTFKHNPNASSTNFGTTSGTNNWIFSNLTFTGNGGGTSYSDPSIDNDSYWSPGLTGTSSYITALNKGTRQPSIPDASTNANSNVNTGSTIDVSLSSSGASSATSVTIWVYAYYAAGGGRSVAQLDGILIANGSNLGTQTFFENEGGDEGWFSITYNRSFSSSELANLRVQISDVSPDPNEDITLSAVYAEVSGGGTPTIATSANANGSKGNFTINGTLTISADTILDNETNNRAFDINGSFSNAGEFQASSTVPLTVADDWTNTGTFTANSGTVTFDSTTTTTITGDTTFNNLTMNTTSIAGGKTINFTYNSTQTISGTWTLDGAAGNVLTLGMNGGVNQTDTWLFNIPAGFTSGDYINVSNSETANVNKIIAGTNVTNGGNNPGWVFQAPPSVGLNTTDGQNFSTGTPGLAFTGTDSSNDDIRYNIQIDTSSSFNSQGGGGTISFVGQTWIPATNGASAPLGSATPHAITPPAGMQNGDVVLVQVVVPHVTEPTVSNTGGQTWTSAGFAIKNTTIGSKLFYAVYDGTWDADPSFATVSNVNGVCLWMGVFRGVDTSDVFDADPVETDYAGTPLTLPSVTTSTDNAWVMHAFAMLNNNVMSGQDTNWTGPDGSTGANHDQITNVGGTDTGLYLSKKTQAAFGASGTNVVDMDFVYDGTGHSFALKPSTVSTPLLDKVSGTDAGFSGNPDNTDPFTSGQQVTYTVQAGNSLSPGTYYWRVRGIDPSGSNTYGEWATTRTFTITLGTTVSGTVYQDTADENTPDTTAYTISISIDNAAPGSCTRPTASTYSCSGLTAAQGARIMVYINGNANNANTVTISGGADIPSLDLIVNRLMIGNNNAGSTANADILAFTTYPAAGDKVFSGTSPNLTVSNTSELHVISAKTYAPAGTVTTTPGGAGGNIHVLGTMNMANNALSIGGGIDASTGTFTVGTQTTTLTSTTGTRNINIGTQSFSSLTVNGANMTSVSDRITLASNFTVTGDLTFSGTTGSGIVNGTGSSVITVQGNVSTTTSNKTIGEAASNFTIKMTGTSKTVTFTYASGSVLNFYPKLQFAGSATISNNGGTGTLNFGTNSSNSTIVIDNGGSMVLGTNLTSNYYSITNDGTFDPGTGSFDHNGSFANGATGVCQPTAGTWNLFGTFTDSGTFNASGGTLILDTTTAGSNLVTTKASGTTTFYNLTINAVLPNASDRLSFVNNFTIANDLVFTRTGAGTALVNSTNNSVITVLGNVSAGAAGLTTTVGETSANLKIVMSGTSKTLTFTYSSSGTVNFLPNLEFAGSTTVSNNGGTGTLNFGANNVSSTVVINSAKSLAVGTSLTSKYYSITNNGTFDPGSNTFNCDSIFTNSATGVIQQTAGTWTQSADFNEVGTFTANGGTLTFDSTSPTTFTANPAGTTTLYNLTISTTLANFSDRLTFVNNFTVANDLSVTRTASGTALVNSTNNSVVTVQGNASILTSGANIYLGETANNFKIKMTGASKTLGISANTGHNISLFASLEFAGSTSVTYNNSGAGTVLIGTNNAASTLVIDNGATFTMNSSSVAYSFSSFTINGTFYTNSYNPSIPNTFANNGTLRVQGGESLAGITTKDIDSGTVEYAGTGVGNFASLNYGANFYNLKINGAVGDAFAINGSTAVNGDFILTQGTFTTNGALNVKKNWTREGGVFTPSTQAVTLSGIDNSTGQTISGDTSFYDLIIDPTGSVPTKYNFTAGTTTAVTHQWTVTGTASPSQLVTLTSTNTWYVQPAAATVDYANVAYSNSNLAICATHSTDGLNNSANWTFTSQASCNAAPNTPTALTQGKTSGANDIAESAWTNGNQPWFGFNVTDPDAGNTVKYRVQVDGTGSTFANIILDYTHTALSASGTTFAYQVGQSGGTYSVGSQGMNLSDSAAGYWWRVYSIDNSGVQSASPAYFGTQATVDFKVDASAPTGLTVYDGADSTDDEYNTGALNSLSAYWTAANFNVSGGLTPNKYQYAIGTSAGGNNIKDWTATNTEAAEVNVGSLTLHTGQTYFFTVRAYDNAGNITTVSSNGQAVLPTFTVTLDTYNSGNLGEWDDLNSYSGSTYTTLQTDTNAYHGFKAYIKKTYALRNEADIAKTIADIVAPWTAPAAWPATCGTSATCLGYTTTDTDISGSTGFSGPLYAAIPTDSGTPGSVASDYYTLIQGIPVSQSNDITYKVQTLPSLAAGKYSTNIMYTVVPEY
jgi:hypothetical protein